MCLAPPELSLPQSEKRNSCKWRMQYLLSGEAALNIPITKHDHGSLPQILTSLLPVLRIHKPSPFHKECTPSPKIWSVIFHDFPCRVSLWFSTGTTNRGSDPFGPVRTRSEFGTQTKNTPKSGVVSSFFQKYVRIMVFLSSCTI